MTERERSDSEEERLRQWLLQGLGGDGSAYRTFLTEIAARLRAYFRRRLRGLPEEVEDLVQETLLAIHNQRQTYDAGLPLTAWVHAIAKYKLIDLLRRRSGRDTLTDPLDESHALLVESDTEAADAHRDVHRLLDLLPEHHRLPIVRTKLEGLSVAEAARVIGMSESAVKVGVHRGLKALARLMRGAE